MKQAIAITSIFPPTEAIAGFVGLPDWSLIVAGDRKSPREWAFPGVRYLSVEDQEAMAFETVRKLPFNHYGRKMAAYLLAISEGAETIAESDDDNIPYEGWAFPAFSGRFLTTKADIGYTNVYRAFTDQHIWPRGYPLDRVLVEEANTDRGAATEGQREIGVWQGLADKDPDVDAIYRLTNNQPCVFDQGEPLVLDAGTYCPFNSQNTAFRKEAFPLLYLPSYVTFRFTDILRGLVAQPILHAAGFRLGFLKATVYQERNVHDYMKDFVSEIPCFLHPYRVVEECAAVAKVERSVGDNLMACYERLVEIEIVPAQELELLGAWLSDLESLNNKA